MLKTKNKVHIIHFTMKPGGIEVLLPGIIKTLDKFSFSVFAIRPLINDDNSVYADVDVKITTGAKGLKAYKAIYLYARLNKNDIFQVFNLGPMFLFVLRMAGLKHLIYSIHGTIYWKTSFQKIVRKIFWNLGMSKNYLITANSEYSAKIFRENVLNRETIILYNPIDNNRFNLSKKKIRSSQQKKIIYSGRLAKGKNLELWIDIAKYIISKNKEYCFEIYGIGPLENQLQEQIKKLGLEDYVKLKGYTNQPEFVYKSADLLLFLSEYESFGNVVVESILCGTPVICSNIPSMREIFQNNTEYLVNLDKNIFANVLAKINNLNHLQEITQTLSEEFIIKYGHQTHYKKLEELYNSF